MESDNDYTEFVGELIEAVQKRKCIYNKKHPMYYNKQERERAWCKVASEVKHSAVDCQKRWKLLREKYAKELKKRDRALANGENYHSNWSCYNKIHFVEDQITPRSKKIGKCRYFFVPAYCEKDKLPNNDDSQSSKSLLHSTNDSTFQQQQDHINNTRITHFQPTVKLQCPEKINNCSISENSTFNDDHTIVKDESCNIQEVHINDITQQQIDPDMIEKSDPLFVQQKIHEWLKANCFARLYADGAGEGAKQEQSKTLTKDVDDSDSLFGKMVTTMLRDIHLEDIKDEVKLHILQLLIKAKRTAKIPLQD